MGETVRYSIVIPAFNEEGNVEPLTREVAEVLEGMGEPYEVIWVDDGSRDATAERVRQVAAAGITPGGEVRLIQVGRQSGQTSAMDLGMRAARGEIVITMDADRQNDPRDIPRLVAALEGYDVAVGWRQNRQDTWVKKVTSKIANAIRIAVTKDPIHDTGCSLKAFRRPVIDDIKLFHGMHRFLSTLAKMEGYRVVEVPVSHRPRVAGKSKYSTLNRLIGPLLDLLAVRWMQSRSLYRRRHG
ncbi:MAG: glycosyltransferase [Nitrospirae bacterium]|nr:MAG: glycosyltransferase [Nitrospirota bacterium]